MTFDESDTNTWIADNDFIRIHDIIFSESINIFWMKVNGKFSVHSAYDKKSIRLRDDDSEYRFNPYFHRLSFKNEQIFIFNES